MVRKKVKLYYFTKILLSRAKTDLKIYALFLLFLLPFYRPFFWLQERKLKSCVAQPFLFTSLALSSHPRSVPQDGHKYLPFGSFCTKKSRIVIFLFDTYFYILLWVFFAWVTKKQKNILN